MNISMLPTLLIITSLIIVPYVGLFVTDIVFIDVNCSGEYVIFIDALYPEGFKNIGKALVKGRSLIHLDVGDVRKAWDREFHVHGRYAPLTLRITVYDDRGLVDVVIKRIDFDKIASTRTIRLDIGSDGKEYVENPKVMYPPLFLKPSVQVSRILEDSFEWNATIVFAMLGLDNLSFGELRYIYNGIAGMGFTVYLTLPDTRLAGWISLGRRKQVLEDLFIPSGGEGYVWMTFKYCWEKWRVWGPGLPPEGLIEEYIYIIDFYPNTAKTGYTPPSDAVFTSPSHWETRLYEAHNIDLPYFNTSYGVLGNRYISVDLRSFADTLFYSNKISENTWSSIKTSIPVIVVDSYTGSIPSYRVYVDVYSIQAPMSHIVSVGGANVAVNGLGLVPVAYIMTSQQ